MSNSDEEVQECDATEVEWIDRLQLKNISRTDFTNNTEKATSLNKKVFNLEDFQ